MIIIIIIIIMLIIIIFHIGNDVDPIVVAGGGEGLELLTLTFIKMVL